jgi:hypothetical protein
MPVVVIGVWAPTSVLLLALAVRQAVDWWHGRRQQGRHHPRHPGQRTVEEIAARLRRERERPGSRRAITVQRRTPAR